MSGLERRLAAIFAADVAGYSRQMSADEVGTLRRLEARREIMDRLIAGHGGRIANTAGDSAAIPNSVSPLRARIVALVQMQRLDEAVAVGRAVLALNPALTVVAFRSVQPFRDGAFVERYMSALSSAGIPD